MASVFIVRPFGTKSVTIAGQPVEVDFNRVHKSLIQPAVEKNGLECRTTEVIAAAGNIRLDMFQMLIAYDLVIADISIDNANVFYELGIRHGLRPNGTILIRFPSSGKDVPFDLKTDRYIQYDHADPAAVVDLLARSIRDTIRDMRKVERKPDSPVFLLLPELRPPDPALLIVVPRDFQEAVERAESDAENGRPTLALLGEEARRNAWAREGVRLVARAQRRIRNFPSARDSWQFIQKDLPDDIEANLQLATLHQRLGDLVSSSQACRHVLENEAAGRKDRADARSQLARNAKASWGTGFRKAATIEARRQLALADERLIEAFEGYREGFAEDLNDYYSGINALGLSTAIVALAEAEAEIWAGCFETADKARNALDDHREQLERLRGAVRMSLDNARQQAKRSARPDEWLAPSAAQYGLLTSDNTAFFRRAYQAAKNGGGTGFSVESEAAQVALFLDLGLFTGNCRAALEAIGAVSQHPGGAGQPTPPSARDRTLVATGHRADAPNRSSPRFPNTPGCIASARAWLRKIVEAEKAKGTGGSVSGIAGAASGTDLLFHEVCAELGIATKVVLPIPMKDYCRESVADGGSDWMDRFDRLVAANPPVILSDSDELPGWAETIPDYGVFQRGNIWMMQDALLRPNSDTTLIALWNGRAGDGPGGTADMVRLAREHAARICVQDTDDLFGLQKQP